MRACAALAANLTAHYWSTASYYDHAAPSSSSSSLVDYLSDTGVLLTMCLDGGDIRNLCGLREPQISGSWIQQATIGPRVFGDQEGELGVVLDPSAVHMDCLYPLDAATMSRGVRDGYNKCGPLDIDDDESISWFQKQLVKTYLPWIKLRYFRHTKWKDIPCSDLMARLSGDGGGRRPRHEPPVLVDHNDTWVSSFETSIEKQIIERIVGHTICYDDIEPTFDDDTAMLLYGGDDPWVPEDWAANVDATQAAIARAPFSIGIWNEIVVSSNRTDKGDLVQGVFYYKSPDRDENRWTKRQAKKLAEVLGKKPVLVFDPTNEHHLFKCAGWIELNDDPEFKDASLVDVD